MRRGASPLHKKNKVAQREFIMQKVELTFKTPVATIKDGKPVIEYQTETAMHIVASTKSKNNLLEEYQQNGKIPTSTKVQDVFLDRVKTEKAVEEIVKAQVDDKEIVERVIDFVKKALDGACVYYKPIVRKK